MVQAALDKISEGRTTNVIAHRLSAIKNANKIIILRNGTIIDQGTHQELLSNKLGPYWALVTAQQLPMDDSFKGNANLTQSSSFSSLVREPNTVDLCTGTTEETEPLGLHSCTSSFGRLILEQTALWPWYISLTMGCLAAGSKFAFLP